jgi:hypothetical protein
MGTTRSKHSYLFQAEASLPEGVDSTGLTCPKYLVTANSGHILDFP